MMSFTATSPCLHTLKLLPVGEKTTPPFFFYLFPFSSFLCSLTQGDGGTDGDGGQREGEVTGTRVGGRQPPVHSTPPSSLSRSLSFSLPVAADSSPGDMTCDDDIL